MYILVSLLQCGQDCHCQQVTVSLPAFTECAWESGLQNLADSVTDAVSVMTVWISAKKVLLIFAEPSLYITIQSLCTVPRARPVRFFRRREWRKSLTIGAKIASELSVGSAWGVFPELARTSQLPHTTPMGHRYRYMYCRPIQTDNLPWTYHDCYQASRPQWSRRTALRECQGRPKVCVWIFCRWPRGWGRVHPNMPLDPRLYGETNTITESQDTQSLRGPGQESVIVLTLHKDTAVLIKQIRDRRATKKVRQNYIGLSKI